jgi:hypothetical protein
MTGHQTERLSHRPQGFNRTPTVDVFQELEAVAGYRIITAAGTVEGAIAVPVIEPKTVNTATTGAGTVLVAQCFDRNAQFGQEFQPAPASDRLDR